MKDFQKLHSVYTKSISLPLSGWGSFLERKGNSDGTSGSILRIAVSKHPPKYKQLDLSEDLKNAMPLSLLPTAATFVMLMTTCGQKHTRSESCLSPKWWYSINFSQGLLNFSSSQKCLKIISIWSWRKIKVIIIKKKLKKKIYPKMSRTGDTIDCIYTFPFPLVLL